VPRRCECTTISFQRIRVAVIADARAHVRISLSRFASRERSSVDAEPEIAPELTPAPEDALEDPADGSPAQLFKLVCFVQEHRGMYYRSWRT
jgi:hypothetical protein